MPRMEQLVFFGILLIVIGFIIVFFGIVTGSKDSSKTKVAVGGFIGPIPFGFGNDKQMVWFVVITSLIIFLVWVLFNFRIIK